MAIEVLMPALSPTMTHGTVAKWLVKEGDIIETGTIIAEIETDKATMEVEAVDDGIMGKIIIASGTENIAVNSVIAYILDEGEQMPASVDGTVNALNNNSLNTASNATNNTADAAQKPITPYPVAATPQGQPAIMAETAWAGPTKKLTIRQALCEAMSEEMHRDADIFLMGEEVAEYQGAYKVSQGLLDEFGPKRVIDTPITESGFTGIGVGAAFYGLKPIIEFMTFNFSMQAIDHIINSASKTLYMSGGQISCPIVFRGPNGAASRVGAQHSQCFASWYAHCPGLKVIAPYSASDAKGLLKAAIRDPNPVIFLENELLYGEEMSVPDTDDYIVPIGKASIVQEGEDVTIIAFSIMVKKAMEAATILKDEHNINAEIIDLRTIRPLDIATIIESVQKTNRVVLCEEGWAYAGIGSEISAIIMEKAFDWLDAPVQRVTGKDVPLPYAANLEQLALPQTADIVASAQYVCYK